MEKRSDKMLQHLKTYYSDDNKLKCIVNVINSNDTKNIVSLRLIDWLVTNYSKSCSVTYKIDGRTFNMHQNYKDMLKAYSKKLFDPFRRHDRLNLKCKFCPDGILETTVAQLTFFKWALDNDVIAYANVHKTDIKKHMDKHTSHRKLKTSEKPKRKELSKPSNIHKVFDVNIKIVFD
jgi:hypothetical protein